MAKKQKVIGAAKFKEQCLRILEKIDPEGIIITKNGKPVAKLFPIEMDRTQYIGQFSKSIKVKGDIFTTGVKWDAES